MDGMHMAALFTAAVIVGSGRASVAQYRQWKERRADLPADARNYGFWTDNKVSLLGKTAHYSFWTFVWTHVVLAVGIVGIALSDWLPQRIMGWFV